MATAPRFPAPSRRPLPRALVAVVWAALLVAGDLPSTAWAVVTGAEPPSWLRLAGVAALALAVIGASLVERWRPIRGVLLSALAFGAGSLAADALAFLVPRRWDAAMLARSALQLVPCLFLAASLIGSGLKPRDVFLAVGDVRAPNRLAPWLPPWSWAIVGPTLMVLLAGGLSVQLALTMRPDVNLAGRAFAALPLALAFAALNAAQEEFRYRAVLLARLAPLVGATHALLATSLLFGLAHWFGHPSGPSGVLLAAIAGWVWGRAMLDTGGFGWAWLIHAAQDVVIVLAIAISKAGPLAS